MKKILISIIRFYRKYLSRLKGRGTCIYVPTCSEYAIEALEKHGVVKGSLLAIFRILRCNPFSKGGYDPVPEVRKGKKVQKMMLLAQAQQSTGNGGILAPFVIIFGWIIRAIYDGLAAMGIYNVGLCIILFTLVSKLILLPVTMKQQRSMKINQHMQPEINKITKKYRNKRDQASMMKQQEEMQKVYAKYGSSPTGGCLPTLIQFPIIMALYYVIRGVNTYIPQIARDVQFKPNLFLGMDLNSAPGFRLTPLLIIPVLSFIFQFLSAKTSMSTTQMDDSTPGAGMTKSMMYTMPLMSFVMCISLPIGIGLYWSASALFQYIQQVAFNYHYDHADMDKIIEKSREKAAKKKKKKRTFSI